MRSIVIIGAGGFAREAEWLIRDINADLDTPAFQPLGFLASQSGEHDSPSLGDFDWLEQNRVDCAAMGIGDPSARNRLSRELKSRFRWLEWPPLIHPSVQFDRASCRVEEGAIICAGVIATVNVTFGAFCLVNLSCTIGHESTIGSGTVINPIVAVSGGVTIAPGVLVGTGAKILQYVSIGDGATVGAGAVVNQERGPEHDCSGRARASSDTLAAFRKNAYQYVPRPVEQPTLAAVRL